MTFLYTDDDRIWKALADGRRRQIIDVLASSEKTTGDLVGMFPELGRTGVLRHITILEEAELIRFRRDGRTRWNRLNLALLEGRCGKWIAQHAGRVFDSARRLKSIAAASAATQPKKPH